MVEVQTYEVNAIPAPFSLAQQRVKFGNHCCATQELIVVKRAPSSATVGLHGV
jgi:hypothetical protein